MSEFANIGQDEDELLQNLQELLELVAEPGQDDRLFDAVPDKQVTILGHHSFEWPIQLPAWPVRRSGCNGA
jgi:hypothetical protein